jgi:pyridoxamine 5'-phosphate oxidase
MMVPAARIDSLPLIEAACWQGLADAAGGRTHEWSTLVLATVDGDRGDARTVVLREVHRDARELVFFTDSRSPKVAQMGQHPRGTLLAWSPTLNWQLRLGVTLLVETDGLGASSRWARLKLSPAADDYLSPLAPGTPVERFVTDHASRAHFAVVAAAVESLDWLELHADGHRRACFDAAGARWLQP